MIIIITGTTKKCRRSHSPGFVRLLNCNQFKYEVTILSNVYMQYTLQLLQNNYVNKVDYLRSVLIDVRWLLLLSVN